MVINLDYLKENYRPEEVDVEEYGVFIEMEAFVLIRELLGVANKLRAEVIDLRNEVNGLTPAGAEKPYPYPASDIPEFSFFISRLISRLYKYIFGEYISPDD